MGKVMSGIAAVLLVIGSLIGSGQPAVDGRGTDGFRNTMWMSFTRIQQICS